MADRSGAPYVHDETWAFERRPETGTTLPATRRSGAIQKISYALLITVMCGVATGWLGAE